MDFDPSELARMLGSAGVVGLLWGITRLISVIRHQNAANRVAASEQIDVVVARQQKWIEEQDNIIAGLKVEVTECSDRYDRLSGEFRAHRAKNDMDQLESNRKLSDLRHENDELRAEITWMKNVLAQIPSAPPSGM